MGRPSEEVLSGIPDVGLRHFLMPSGQLVSVGRPVELLTNISVRPQFAVPLTGHDAKRLMDIAAALTALILLAPLFLLVAALIKLTSPGPVFFKQSRPGLGRRP